MLTPRRSVVVPFVVLLSLSTTGLGHATNGSASRGHVVAAQAGAPQPLGVSPVPLSVLSTRVERSQQTVTFTLQNTGTRVVTAWDVGITVGTEPDARYANHGVDAFRQFAALAEGTSYIVPGGTVTATAKLPSDSENLTPVVITPRAAVFADTSFVGDDKFAQLIFERRGAQLDAWRDIAVQLQDTRSKSRVDVTALEALLSQVNMDIAQKGGDIVRVTFRANLSRAIADVRAGRGQPVSVLDRFLTDAQRNITATASHAKR